MCDNVTVAVTPCLTSVSGVKFVKRSLFAMGLPDWQSDTSGRVSLSVTRESCAKASFLTSCHCLL